MQHDKYKVDKMQKVSLTKNLAQWNAVGDFNPVTLRSPIAFHCAKPAGINKYSEPVVRTSKWIIWDV